MGKYLLELPYYLLPWTLVAAAALRSAWRQVRLPGVAGRPWRFAVGASLPFLALISVAATAREVYAAPLLLGIAALAGLWLQQLRAPLDAFDQFCITGTRVLVAAVGVAFIAAVAVFGMSHTVNTPGCVVLGIAVLGSGALAWLRSSQAQRHADPGSSLLWSYSGYAAAVCLTALLVLPVIDQWQDLGGLARRVRAETDVQQLVLLDPDETTVAVLDHGFPAPVATLLSGPAGKQGAVRDWFAGQPATARVLVLLPGHASSRMSRWLAQFHTPADPGDGVAAALVDSGTARLVRRYDVPQGRRYALLGPPAH